MKSLLTVVCIFALIASVFGHAKLDYPKAYNPNPSTTQPCGGAPALTLPAATWTQRANLNITWEIVAADGNGEVIMVIDTTGGTSFTSANPMAVTIPLNGTNPTSGPNRPYLFTFTVPADLVCTSTNYMCAAQVHSADWYACTNVQVMNFVADPSSTTGSAGGASSAIVTNAFQCQTLTPSTGVEYCSYKLGGDYQVSSGETPAAVDQYVRSTFYQNINNTNVFANGTLNPACAPLYKTFLCDSEFPPCSADGVGSCVQQCLTTMAACGLTDIHAGLYKCNSYPQTCGGYRLSVMSLMVSAIVPLFLAFFNRL